MAQVPSKEKVGSLRALLEKAQPQIKMALPRHMTPERMLRVTMTAIQRTPDLLDCEPLTVVASVVQASQLGLEPDGILGHAYLVPFNNRKTGRKECQLIPGYKGLIDLARRSGHVQSISAHVVYEKDHFDFVFGLEEKLSHRPCMSGDRGSRVCAYAIAHIKGGGYAFDVMTMEEIEKVRGRSQAAHSKFSPWSNEDDYDAMCRKTVIRRLCKYLPLSPEMAMAISLDERSDAGIPQDIEIELHATEAARAASEEKQSELRDKYRPNGEGGDGDRQPNGDDDIPDFGGDARE